MLRRTNVIRVLVLLALIVLLPACNKGNVKDLNKIVITGNSDVSVEYNATYVPVSGTYYPPSDYGCTPTIYYSNIFIYLSPVATLVLTPLLETSNYDLAVGTFTINNAECEEGIMGSFALGSDRKFRGLYFSSGTVTITSDGDGYNVDLDLVIDSEVGGGTMKGNFNGEISRGLIVDVY